MSYFVGTAGCSVFIAIGIGMFKAMHVNSAVQNNNRGLSAFNAFGAAAELALALPWFILEKRRPGLPYPGGMNIVQAGLWQLYRASKDIWKLKQSLMYLISELSYFHLRQQPPQIGHSLLPPRRCPEYNRDHRLHSPE